MISGEAKKCKDCEYFRIDFQPLRVGRDIFDSGQAECTKHNLITDFTSTKKINRLECVEDSNG